MQAIAIDANTGAQSLCDFRCATSDFDIKTAGDIKASISITDSFKGRYRLIVTSQVDNASNETTTIGSISFVVNGVEQSGKIDVVQRPAINYERSRILLNGNIGAQFTLAALSPFACTVATTSSAFSAVCNADNTITLTTTTANSDNDERKAGKIVVSLRDYPSCSYEIDVWQRSATSRETLLFHFIGTSLRSYFQTNLNMIEEALSGDLAQQKRIITFMQSSTNAAEMHEIYFDKIDKKVYSQPLKKVTLPAEYTADMLADIWRDMIAAAPATEYSLIVGSHGLGWVPKNRLSATSKALLDSQFATYWQYMPNAEAVRYIGEGTSLTLIDTTDFAAACSMMEQPFRYIMFDACYMSNIEAAYDMRNSADYIFASPCEMLARGLPYNVILPIMLGDDATDVMLDKAAKMTVDTAIANTTGGTVSACTAVIKCSQLEALAASFKGVYGSVGDAFDITTLQTYDGTNAWSHPNHHFFDVMDFAKQACSDAAALSQFEQRYAECVSAIYHTPSFYSAFNNSMNEISTYYGVSTSLPILYNAEQLYDAELQQTAWFKAITE